MNLGWRPSSVRLRLALWYSAAVALVLLIYAAGVYVFVRNSLRDELDRALHDDFEIVEQLLDTKASETGAWPATSGHHADDVQSVRWMEVWSPAGQVRFRSSGMENMSVPASAPSGYEYASVTTVAGTRTRTLTAAHTVGSSQFVVRVDQVEKSASGTN